MEIILARYEVDNTNIYNSPCLIARFAQGFNKLG